jgi:hypothetical protein
VLDLHRPLPTPSLLSPVSSLVLSLYLMQKVDPRNKLGVVVHTVSKKFLGNHTANNVYQNVNYAKTFIQGTIVSIFDGRACVCVEAAWLQG